MDHPNLSIDNPHVAGNDRSVGAEPVRIDMADPRCPFRTDVYGAYAELRARGPVTQVAFGPAPDTYGEGRNGGGQRDTGDRRTFMVTHYGEGATTVLDDRFSSDPSVALSDEQRAQLPPQAEDDPPLSRSLLTLDPPDHTRLRKLVQPSFTKPVMERLRPQVQAIADRLLDDAERHAAERGEHAPDRRMDVIEAFAHPLPVIVICRMLGIPPEDQQTIEPWAKSLSATSGPRMPEEARAHLRQFMAYLRELFERKRRSPSDDMISRLVHAEEDGDRLDERELLSMIFLLFLAGHVTTTGLIGNGVVALLTHPDQQALVTSDPSLAKGLVEETLRYWGPVDSITRIARQDVELGGTAISKGEIVTISLGSADRDTARFSDPDVFDVTRPDAARHVAFGKGIHSCLGAPLARVEGQVAIPTLLGRFPQLRLAVPAHELPWRADFLRGLERLPVCF